jgi:ABC-type amino acid transport system permease subunit
MRWPELCHPWSGLQVSFTGLAARSFGPIGGQVVAVVYAALNYSLLVACIAGLGEIVGNALTLPPAVGCAAATGKGLRRLWTVRRSTVDQHLTACSSPVSATFEGRNAWSSLSS